MSYHSRAGQRTDIYKHLAGTTKQCHGILMGYVEPLRVVFGVGGAGGM